MDIKNIDWAATDALCFDMDGTLWDAVDSYCEIWNRCFRKVGMDRVVARQELIACMGLNLHEILRRLCGGVPMPDADAFLSDIEREEIRLMPVLGGKPYPGVAEGLVSSSMWATPKATAVRHILPGCRLSSPRMVSAIVTMPI